MKTNADIGRPRDPKPPRHWEQLPKRAWITGAGKGIGRAVARRLVADGWTVFASARTASDLYSLADETAAMPGAVRPIVLDVTDPAAAAKVVADIGGGDAPLGLVILNAGTHTPTPANGFDIAAAKHLIDVNLIGTLNTLAPVMQAFRAQGFGKIAIVASVAGYRGLPTAAAYSASKAGLIALAEALYPELRRDGVSLALINPGFVKTPLTDKNEFPMPFLMDVEDAVTRIIDGLRRDRFEIAFPTRFMLMLKLLRILPYSLYFKLTGRLVS